MYYKLLEGYTVTLDGDGAKTYGVAVYDIVSVKPVDKDSLANKSCVYKNDDITFSLEEMSQHIELWNELQPTLPQLKDLIEDIICDNMPQFVIE